MTTADTVIAVVGALSGFCVLCFWVWVIGKILDGD